MSADVSTPSVPDDRRIHAACGEWQIVRYDRAGKWYVEYDPPRMRPARRIGVSEAAHLAWQMHKDSVGHIWFGVPGGQVFDRKVRARGL